MKFLLIAIFFLTASASLAAEGLSPTAAATAAPALTQTAQALSETAQAITATAQPITQAAEAGALSPVAATLAVTPSPLAAPWDTVTLKDGQRAEGKIRGYDAFFLDFELKNATKAHLPWVEIGAIQPAEFSGDMAMMKQYLKDEAAEVQTRIEPKSPSRARGKALYPGFFIHGYGFKEAGNQDMFLSLAGAELFGLVVGGFGAARSADATLSQGERDTSISLALGGASVFVLSWLVDIIGSGYSAENFNEAHHLAFGAAPLNQGTALVASVRFQ